MYKGNWWCPVCKCEVVPEDVTFEELHDRRKGGCGEPVLSEKPKEPRVIWVRFEGDTIHDVATSEIGLSFPENKYTTIKFQEVI